MTAIGTHSDLHAFFAQESLLPFGQTEWDTFRTCFSTPPADLAKPLSELPVDYSKGVVASSWRDTAYKIGRILLMIIIFPWGLYAGIKYLFQRLVMTFIFPLQNGVAKSNIKPYNIEILNQKRQEIQADLNKTHPQQIDPSTFVEGVKNPYLVRQIVLEKEGRRYRALMIATAESLRSRNWVLQAPGNGMPIEYCAQGYAHQYAQDQNASLLIVQGPGAGGNDGEVPTTDLGEPFELGLCCIETDFKAKEIMLCGHSLGGASIGQAIKQHTFNKEKHKYIVVRQMTFDSTANMGYRWFGFNKWFTCSCLGLFVEWIVKWTDCHIDNVASSRVLQEKQIVEIIIQAGVASSLEGFQGDGVIPKEACLARALIEQGITQHKIFQHIPYADHTTRDVRVATSTALAFLNQSC